MPVQVRVSVAGGIGGEEPELDGGRVSREGHGSDRCVRRVQRGAVIFWLLPALVLQRRSRWLLLRASRRW